MTTLKFAKRNHKVNAEYNAKLALETNKLFGNRPIITGCGKTIKELIK